MERSGTPVRSTNCARYLCTPTENHCIVTKTPPPRSSTTLDCFLSLRSPRKLCPHTKPLPTMLMSISLFMALIGRREMGRRSTQRTEEGPRLRWRRTAALQPQKPRTLLSSSLWAAISLVIGPIQEIFHRLHHCSCATMVHVWRFDPDCLFYSHCRLRLQIRRIPPLRSRGYINLGDPRGQQCLHPLCDNIPRGPFPATRRPRRGVPPPLRQIPRDLQRCVDHHCVPAPVRQLLRSVLLQLRRPWFG